VLAVMMRAPALESVDVLSGDVRVSVWQTKELAAYPLAHLHKLVVIETGSFDGFLPTAEVAIIPVRKTHLNEKRREVELSAPRVNRGGAQFFGRNGEPTRP
jgi:hypothetical protein